MRRALLLLLLPLTVAQADQWVGAPGGGGITAREIDRLLAEHRLGDKENIKAMSITESAHVKQLLVQVRDREPLHYHADSDLTVFLLRGKGEIEIRGERHQVTAGDVIHIPRRAVHAYINHGPEIGVALVVMSPPPGPHDRVLVPGPAGKWPLPASQDSGCGARRAGLSCGPEVQDADRRLPPYRTRHPFSG